MSAEREFLDRLEGALRPGPTPRHTVLDTDDGRSILFCSDGAGRTGDNGVLFIPAAVLDE